MDVPKNNIIPMSVPGSQPQIEPKYLAMAAAIMRQQAQKASVPKVKDGDNN